MKTFNTNTENKEEWLTPPYILEALGGFDLDPCAPEFRPWDMAKVHYCKEQDGLSQNGSAVFGVIRRMVGRLLTGLNGWLSTKTVLR